MAVYAPQKSAFNSAAKHHNQLKWFEIGSGLLTALFTGLTFFSLHTFIEGAINVLSIILLIVALYFKTRFRISYREAEKIRRDSLIDNSFGSKLAETEAVGYYSNTGISEGILKLLASIHESSILSLSVINKMLWKQALLNLIVGVILIVACTISSLQSKIFLALFNGFMSIDMIGGFIELCILKAEIHKVTENCKNICESYLEQGNDTLTNIAQAHIVRECLRYETALSYASIMLDSSEYRKINAVQTRKWEKIKNRYYG